MNAIIEHTPPRPPLAETPYSAAEGDEFVQKSQRDKALAKATDRTRERGCKQQIRLGQVPGRGLRAYWIIQDVR